jgi:hypothetical protein
MWRPLNMKNRIRGTLITDPFPGHLYPLKVALIAFLGAITALWLLAQPAQAPQITFLDRIMVEVARVETGHLPEHIRDKAVSRCGAIGRYQIMPFHAKGFGYKVKDLYNPKINKMIAYKLMAGYYKSYGNWGQALAAYNGGHRQARTPQEQRCLETRRYVRAILRKV